MEKKLAEGIEERKRAREENREASDLDSVTPAKAMPRILGLPKRNVETIQPEAEEEPSFEGFAVALREGLTGVRANFTKYPNEVHDLMASMLDINESIAYMRLWRDSWGFGRNYCRVGYGALVKGTSIRSRNSAIAAIKSLRKKCFIALILDRSGRALTNQAGSIYRIFAPEEIISGTTEEGVPLSGIPESGIPHTGIVKKQGVMGSSGGIPESGIPESGIPQPGSTSVRHTPIPESGIPQPGTPEEKLDQASDEVGVPRSGIPQSGTDLKKDIKDTLSPDLIVDLFYKGIGQNKISSEKREKSIKCIEELTEDGFNQEDIAWAAEWTPDNATEKIYDFSILKHTIGQAMAARKKLEAEEETRLEKERKIAELEAQEKQAAEEEERIQAYKESLPDQERKRLRTLAEENIRDSGQYKTEFVTEALIGTQENEIIRSEKK